MNVVDFGRGKAMKLKPRILCMQRGQQVLVPLDVEVWVQAALHKYAGTAKLDRLINSLADLLDRMNVRIRLSWAPIERTEGADYIANVGVINVAVDDVCDNIRRIVPHPDLMRGEADPHKIVRFEQGG